MATTSCTIGTVEINLSTLAKHFSDEVEAYKLVESMRWCQGPVGSPWADGPICPTVGRLIKRVCSRLPARLLPA